MAYSPTLEDFKEFETYQPSEEDFNTEDETRLENKLSNLNLPKNPSLGDFLKQAIKGSALNFVSKASETPAANIFGKELSQGASESIPRTLNKGIQGISQLFGNEGVNLPHEELSKSLLQSLGRGIGEAGSYGVMAAPLALGTEAALGSMAPGFLGRAIGSGLSGSALEPGNFEDRLKEGAKFAGTSLGLEALDPLKNVGKSLLTKYKPRDAATIIQNGYKDLKDNLSNMFNSVKDEAIKSGIKEIPVRKEIFNEILEEGNKTKSFKKLVSSAETGDYNSLRKLQTELGQRSESFLSSKSPSDKDTGNRILELREEINDAISDKLKNSGRTDLVDILNKARKGWSEMIDIYHTHPSISKLVGKNKLIPKNLLSTLTEDSERMRLLKSHHPEIETRLKLEEQKKKLKNITKTLALGGAGAKLFLSGNKTPILEKID